MSILDMITTWKADGKLAIIRRTVETSPPVAYVLATPGVQSALHGPWNSNIEEERYRTMKAVLDLFSDGDVMSVRMPPSKSARAQLALLTPSEAAVWEFRTRPDKKRLGLRYGVRVFGMFAKKRFVHRVLDRFQRESFGRQRLSAQNRILPTGVECLLFDL